MSQRVYISRRSTCPMLRQLSAVLCALVIAGPGSMTAWGQWEQIHKLTADDAAVGDEFGVSVSITGDVAIVGTRFDNDAGESSGSAYLFDLMTGEQLHKLTADDGAPDDNFGRSVGISGSIAIVGASGDNDAGDFSGSAYLFDVATGVQLHKLTADDAAALDSFGRSVGINGGIAIVGAPGDDDAGGSSGSAYLFNVVTGRQLHKLTADDAAAGDFFGFSVAMSGAIAIVGAHGNDDSGGDSGSAYLFNVITGQQLHKLTADDATAIDFFGYSVGVSDAIAIVGARLDDDAGSNSGSAYVFEQSVRCPADLDGDGEVGAGDLAILLGAWGPNPDHPADFNGDGNVGPFDLAMVLGNWGSCP